MLVTVDSFFHQHPQFFVRTSRTYIHDGSSRTESYHKFIVTDITVTIFKLSNLFKDSFLSQFSYLGYPLRFKSDEEEFPKALKLQYRPFDDEICCLCSTWTDSEFGEPMSLALESRLFLNGLMYLHGSFGFLRFFI